jgi:hypothetical protein
MKATLPFQQQVVSSVARRSRVWLPLLVVVLFAGVAAACPTCKDGLAQNDPQGRSLAAGFFYSILFMMSMPFVIVTTFGCFAYRAVKRAKAQQALEAGIDQV